MWAPADLFTPTVNAMALALKRAVTLAWNHLPFLLIAVLVVIAIVVAIKQIRRTPSGRD